MTDVKYVQNNFTFVGELIVYEYNTALQGNANNSPVEFWRSLNVFIYLHEVDVSILGDAVVTLLSSMHYLKFNVTSVQVGIFLTVSQVITYSRE